MKNSIGESVILTIFGESHGAAVGAVLDGLAPGIPVDEEYIAGALARRRPRGRGETARVEQDRFQILSGVFNGKTTGTPLAIVIPNENVRSGDYGSIASVARPAHADFAAECKYHGFQDYRGGGHFSGRITAGIVAAGAVCRRALSLAGMEVGVHILSCAGVQDRAFVDAEADVKSLEGKDFPVLDSSVEAAMQEAVLAAASEGDSVGGSIQVCVCGLPAGVGEPWFDSLEGVLSRAMFAVGGVKGIEFGDGFALAGMRGSEANDPFRMDGGRVVTATNRNGGINGGISNGMPILFNLAVKPTPSISRTQRSVDFRSGKECELNIPGRHDPAIIRRICPVVEALVSVVLCDMLAQRYGTDWPAALRR